MNQFQLPAHRDLFYGGAWHQATGGTAANVSPSTGQELGSFAVAGGEDVDRAVAAARGAGGGRGARPARGPGSPRCRAAAPLAPAGVRREIPRRGAPRRDELAW